MSPKPPSPEPAPVLTPSSRFSAACPFADWSAGSRAAGDEWTAKPELIRHIQYRQLNLIADPAPSGLFDLVLCRNVMLYLAPEPKKRAFQVIAEALRPSGGLILGAGETVIGQTDLFQIAATGRAVYEKCATDGPFATPDRGVA